MSWENLKPAILMVGCQIMYAGVNLSGRAVLLEGMSSRVFVVYRQFIAFLLIAPIAYFSRRGSKEWHLGWKSFWMIFLLSFVGVTLNQNMFFEGLYLANSTAASALSNLIPALTFLIAYIFRLEKVNLRSLRSIAKISGTVFCVTGASVMALWKGPLLLKSAFSPTDFTFKEPNGQDTWFLGCLFLCGFALCWALWLILQVPVIAYYPDHLWLTAWTCLMAAVQSGILTLTVEPDLTPWTLKSSYQLFCCLYVGVASAATFFAQAWSIGARGPVYSAMFNPLNTVIVTFFAFIVMHEELHVGSAIGALGVIIGLYIVLWGKAKDYQGKDEAILLSQIEGQNDEETTLSAQVSSCRMDLEEPLLPERYSTLSAIPYRSFVKAQKSTM